SLHHEPCIVLFALIALKKFALTSVNKLKIKSRLDQCPENPLLVLENYDNSNDCDWRQVGFCAKWALDNIFRVQSNRAVFPWVGSNVKSLQKNPSLVENEIEIVWKKNFLIPKSHSTNKTLLKAIAERFTLVKLKLPMENALVSRFDQSNSVQT
ncbi:jg22121, partial [Pararge aegeria aegeria]